jgi:hypothetical protein
LSEIPGLYIWRARDNYMSLRRFCGISYIRWNEQKQVPLF